MNIRLTYARNMPDIKFKQQVIGRYTPNRYIKRISGNWRLIYGPYTPDITRQMNGFCTADICLIYGSSYLSPTSYPSRNGRTTRIDMFQLRFA